MLTTGTHPAAIRVDFWATVVDRPRFFYGSRTHAMHEAFDVQGSTGRMEVVDNVAIAPRCPVRPGDRIEICGELVHDHGRIPIVHWTHHDPQGVHPGGFIRLRDRTYA